MSVSIPSCYSLAYISISDHAQCVIALLCLQLVVYILFNSFEQCPPPSL